MKVVGAVVAVVVAGVLALVLGGVPAGAAPRTALTPPSGLTATPRSSSEVALSWRPVAGIGQYQVLRSTTSGGPYALVATVSATSYLDTGRSPATTYYYVVRSKYRTKLSRVSAEASATTAPAVTVVPGLRATADGARVDLEWKPVTQALRYEILHYATTVDEQGEVVGSTTGTRFTDTAVILDHWYVYRVRAVFTGGTSVRSAALSVHTGAPTRLALTVSPEPTEASQAALLVATVTPVTPITDRFTGDVEFYADDVSVGRASVNSSGELRYASLFATLPAGTHTVYAHYAGYSFSGTGTSLGASSSAIQTHHAVPDYGKVTFAGAGLVPYGAGSWPSAVAIADVTGDGRPDVLATTGTHTLLDPDDFSLFVFARQADGTLAQRQVLRTHASTLSAPVRLTTGDVDGDGDTDVAVTGGTGVDIVSQDGGRLMAPRLVPVAGGTVQDALLADVDRDGRPDLVVGHMTGVEVRRNLGGGTFGAPVPVQSSGSGHVEVGDLTGDGRPDIAVQGSFTVLVYAQTLTGGFALHTTIKEPSLFGIESFAIGDVTSDGRADLVTTVSANSPESQLVVHPQTATGGFGPAVQYASYDSPEPLTLADMNGDGRTDVIVAHGGYYAVSVLLQRPDGLLGRGQRSWVPYASHYDYRGIAVGDLDADGKPDIALADYNQGLIVLQQT